MRAAILLEFSGDPEQYERFMNRVDAVASHYGATVLEDVTDIESPTLAVVR